MSYQIAIDGPAGAGKSTIAKKVARLKECIAPWHIIFSQSR